MRERWVAARWRRATALTLAVIALGIPSAVPVAAATANLRISADSTYRVDTNDGVVRVRIDVTATSFKPNSVRRTATQIITTRYYWDRLFFNIQHDARSVRATSGGSSLRVSLDTKSTHRLLTVRMPPLYYRQTRDIRIEYDLPGGKPRSSSDIRVGAAFTTFTAWAWGDDGRSTVRIVLPKGFDDHGYGMDLKGQPDDARLVLTSGTIADPGVWYAVVIADRPAALTHVEIGAALSRIVVQAWPEDKAWRDQASSVLEDGAPVLQELIGLDWPVAGPLTVTEVHTPLLEGYAGIYESFDDAIRIGEDLDAQTILHEASHAWFDTDFVDQRWVIEGLAEEYAARTRAKLDLRGPAAPPSVGPRDRTAFPLIEWPGPSRIDDKTTAAQEAYGYAASWTVIRKIVDAVDEDGMRDVFDAIANRTIAYVGDHPAETTGRTADWRQVLDLVEEIGGAEAADDLFRTWVVPKGFTGALDERAAARTAYHELDAAADEWAPPYLVRESMWTWSFKEATAGIAAAEEVLADRDALDGVSVRLGTSTPNDIEPRFEDATTIEALDALEVELEHRADVAATLIAARDELAAPRSQIADLGLAGEVPAASLDAGLAAYRDGDLDGAVAGSAATVALLAGAEEVGKGRAIAIGAGVAALLLLLLVGIWLLRRRRHRGSLVTVGPGADLEAPITLAATPSPAGAEADPPPAAIPPAPGAEPD